MLGCAIPDDKGHRFYSGPPLPNNEVALVYAVDCNIQDIRAEKEKDVKKLGYGPSRELELLPGQYVTGINYSNIYFGTYYTKTTDGGRVQLNLNLQAGDIWMIYPEIIGQSGNQTWRPILVNIKDYNEEECRKNIQGRICPDKDRIKEKATKYLQGERRIMSYNPPFLYDYGNTKGIKLGDDWN
jgi:hypothetical protein